MFFLSVPNIKWEVAEWMGWSRAGPLWRSYYGAGKQQFGWQIMGLIPCMLITDIVPFAIKKLKLFTFQSTASYLLLLLFCFKYSFLSEYNSNADTQWFLQGYNNLLRDVFEDAGLLKSLKVKIKLPEVAPESEKNSSLQKCTEVNIFVFYRTPK